MKDNLLTFARISAKASGRWLVTLLVGVVMVVVGCGTATLLLHNNTGGGFAGAGTGLLGAALGVLVLFSQEFFTALLLFGSLGMLFLYLMAANKAALQTALHGVWDSKGASFLKPRLTSLVERIQRLQGAGPLTNRVLLQTRLLQENSRDTSVPKLQRRVIGYGLRKVNLETLPVATADELPNLLAGKLEEKIASAAQPSFKPLAYLLLLHIILIGLAVAFDHT